MKNSFLNVSHWIVELKTHTYTCSPKVILCGNKVDLTSERKVDSFLVTKQFRDLNLTYVETSAYTGQGIDQAMEAIAKLVLNSKLILPTSLSISTFTSVCPCGVSAVSVCQNLVFYHVSS